MDVLREEVDRLVRKGCALYGMAAFAAAVPFAAHPAQAAGVGAALLTLLALGLAWRAWTAEGSSPSLLENFALARLSNASRRQMREKLAHILRDSLLRHAEWTGIAAAGAWSLTLALR